MPNNDSTLNVCNEHIAHIQRFGSLEKNIDQLWNKHDGQEERINKVEVNVQKTINTGLLIVIGQLIAVIGTLIAVFLK